LINFPLSKKLIISCSSNESKKKLNEIRNEIDSSIHKLSHSFYTHETSQESNFIEEFTLLVYSDFYDDFTSLTSLNNQLDSLLKQDKNSLISSIQSATKEQEVLHILKEVLNQVGFDWNKYTKQGLPNAPQGQNSEVNNNSQNTGEREENDNPSAKEPAQNKIKKLLLPIIGVISVIGTLLFLAWNKLFSSIPNPEPKSDLTSKKKTLNLKQIFPQAPMN